VQGTQDHGYLAGHVAVGDVYDASNLAATQGPEVFYTWTPTYLKEMQGLGAKYITDAYGWLRHESGEGKTPIARFTFVGHGNNTTAIHANPWIRKEKWGKWTTVSPSGYRFDASRYNYYSPNPSFQRALQRKGPHICWFTKNAEGHAVACRGTRFAEAFAGAFLRNGAKIHASPWEIAIEKADDKWPTTYYFVSPGVGLQAWTRDGHKGFINAVGNTYVNWGDFLRGDQWMTYDGKL
jgi:hypothetical protein